MYEDLTLWPPHSFVIHTCFIYAGNAVFIQRVVSKSDIIKICKTCFGVLNFIFSGWIVPGGPLFNTKRFMQIIYFSNICIFSDMLAPAEPLELTPCCTVPQDKEDTAQANAQWALSLWCDQQSSKRSKSVSRTCENNSSYGLNIFMKSPSEGANECIHLARVRQHITLMARSVPFHHVWT